MLGAGSGVGQAAIQIAWLHGARVFATAGTDEKLARAREIGAHEVVNHHTQDLPAEIRRFTNNRGVDVVIEHVGEATWERSLKCLARGGRLVTCGATTGYKAPIDLRFLFARQYTLMGSYMGTKGGTAARRAVLLLGPAASRRRSHVPAVRGRRGAALPRSGQAVRQSRAAKCDVAGYERVTTRPLQVLQQPAQRFEDAWSASDLTSGDTSPASTDSATVTGSVSTQPDRRAGHDDGQHADDARPG